MLGERVEMVHGYIADLEKFAGFLGPRSLSSLFIFCLGLTSAFVDDFPDAVVECNSNGKIGLSERVGFLECLVRLIHVVVSLEIFRHSFFPNGELADDHLKCVADGGMVLGRLWLTILAGVAELLCRNARVISIAHLR